MNGQLGQHSLRTCLWKRCEEPLVKRGSGIYDPGPDRSFTGLCRRTRGQDGAGTQFLLDGNEEGAKFPELTGQSLQK